MLVRDSAGPAKIAAEMGGGYWATDCRCSSELSCLCRRGARLRAVISAEHEFVFVFFRALPSQTGNSPCSAGIAQKRKIAGTHRTSVLCLLACAPVRVPVAMRAACAGATARRLPLLLKVDMSAGHFSASDRWRPRRPRTRPAAVLKHARTPADTSTQEEQASPVLAGAGGRSCPRRQT